MQKTAYIFKKPRRFSTVVGLAIIGLCYFAAVFADFLAPYNHHEQVRRQPSAPASTIHLRDAAGKFYLRPFIYERTMTDPRERTYDENTTRPFFITAFFKNDWMDLFHPFTGLRNICAT